ncbi:O-antigen ligase domain-containing protein [Sinomicrobium pectinilyticum]|uniref:O-antigen ligase domain-containing protein n=1 Tax=Sinomicrobium pectinilyticum TaxID=1084421 RepID=A0A3N0E6T7_SINP1|nr:O-antigen ligase domain-containing protein [Sinomicrobium pectinilyticum]
MYGLFSFIAFFIDDTTTYYADYYSNKFRIVVESFPLIGQHPIYASLYSGLSIIFLFELIFTNRQKLSLLKKVYYFSSFLVAVLLLIMLSSKGVILSLFFLFLHFLFIKFKRNYKLIIGGVLIFFIGLSMLFVYNRRMNEMLRIESYSTVNSNFSNSFRVSIYDCCFKAISKKWWIGYGVGSVQEELNKCYKDKSSLLLEKTYNSHNQYLDFFLKTGVLGFLFFLFLLTYNFYQGVYHKDYSFCAIILFFGLLFLTENILARQTGVILFSYLLNFLMPKTLDEK